MTEEDGSAIDLTLRDYRAHLVAAEQKAQEDLGKTVLRPAPGNCAPCLPC